MFLMCLSVQASMLEASFQLAGGDSYAARFGETIADLGDIDHDGYHGNHPFQRNTSKPFNPEQEV